MYTDVVDDPASALATDMQLIGSWEGIWDCGIAFSAHLQDSHIDVSLGNELMLLGEEVVDESEGKMRMKWNNVMCIGIYEIRGNRLTICFNDARFGRPRSFRKTKNREIIIFHRSETKH